MLNIKKSLPGIKENISLAEYTTFKIGGPAKYFYIAKSSEDLIGAIKMALKYQIPFFILGEGSNVLVADEGYDGIAIKMKNEKLKIKNYNSKFKIFCESGVPLGKLVFKSLEVGATGLEWAGGIPGTVGGAIRGNAGAFGGSIANVIKSVKVLEIQYNKIRNPKPKIRNKFQTPNLKIKNFKNKDCKFGYRDSIFKHNPAPEPSARYGASSNLIILSCEIQLKKGNKKEIENKIKENLKKRNKTQPVNFFSAGSVFQNPRKFSAGYLIEKCGLKGKKIGKAQISKKHANFIINFGGAKSDDVKKLIDLIKKKVKDKFRIELKEEICYLGFPK